MGDKETCQRWILLSGNLKSNKGYSIGINNIKSDRSALREVTVKSAISIQRK